MFGLRPKPPLASRALHVLMADPCWFGTLASPCVSWAALDGWRNQICSWWRSQKVAVLAPVVLVWSFPQLEENFSGSNLLWKCCSWRLILGWLSSCHSAYMAAACLLSMPGNRLKTRDGESGFESVYMLLYRTLLIFTLLTFVHWCIVLHLGCHLVCYEASRIVWSAAASPLALGWHRWLRSLWWMFYPFVGHIVWSETHVNDVRFFIFCFLDVFIYK